MKKKTILNALMVLIIVLIAVSGLMVVKNLKEPVTAAGAAETALQMSITEKSGIVTVERSGIAYELDGEAAVQKGDVFRSKKSAQLSLSEEKGKLILGENSELKAEDDLTLKRGELFADYRTAESAVLYAEETEIVSEQAVLSLSVQSGSQTVYVYAGTVLTGSAQAQAGQRISMVEQEDGSIETEVISFAASALSDSQIQILQNCKMDDSFCFSADKLDEVLTLRSEEKAKAQQAQLLLAEQS